MTNETTWMNWNYGLKGNLERIGPGGLRVCSYFFVCCHTQATYVLKLNDIRFTPIFFTGNLIPPFCCMPEWH